MSWFKNMFNCGNWYYPTTFPNTPNGNLKAQLWRENLNLRYQYRLTIQQIERICENYENNKEMENGIEIDGVVYYELL